MDASRRPDAARLALLVLIVTALRAFAALRFPMVASEAYYWTWAHHPALGYFDHPPMVAWIGAAFFGWLDASQLAARSGPLVLGALSILLVHRLVRELWPAGGTAWRATLLFALAPIFFAGGVVLMPDTGLLLFCLLTWVLLLRAVRLARLSHRACGADRHNPPAARLPCGLGSALLPWLLAGLAAGGALLSKFHAFALLPPLYGYLLFVPGNRRLLRTPGPWAALCVALLCLAPNLGWNVAHDWVTWAFQTRRSGLGAPGFEAKNLVGYFGGPLVSLSPLLYAAVLLALARGVRARREPETLFLLLAGVPILLLFALLCPFTAIGLHWPAVGFVPLVVLAARRMELGDWPRLRRWTAPVAAVILGLLLAAPEVARRLPDRARLPLFGEKVTVERLKEALVDWPDLGRQVREVVRREGPERFPMTMTDDFHLAALLSFYAAAPERTFVFRDRRANQFGLWLADRPGLLGQDALVAMKVRDEDGFRIDEDDDRRLAAAFESAEPGPLLTVALPGGGRAGWALRILFARGFRGPCP